MGKIYSAEYIILGKRRTYLKMDGCWITYAKDKFGNRKEYRLNFNDNSPMLATLEATKKECTLR